VPALQRRSVEFCDDAPLALGAHEVVEARVELVCQKGCRQVRLDIATLERGGEIPESRGLVAAERGLLLSELRSIMAVYGDFCRIG
jgi:hypothetical protein